MTRGPVLLFALLLSGTSACSAQGIGQPYSRKAVLTSALCHYAPCSGEKARQVGDKFAPVAEQFTVHEWKLKVPVSAMTDTLLTMRTTPRNIVDITKLQFILPKNSTLLSAKDLTSRWLRLLNLSPGIAAECLNNLGRVRFIKLKGLPNSLSGSCIAEEYQYNRVGVTFTINLKTF